MEITRFQQEIESPFDHEFTRLTKIHGNFDGPIGIYSMKSQHRGVFIFVNIINFQKPEKKREAGTTDRNKLITSGNGLEMFLLRGYIKGCTHEFMELLEKLSVLSDLQKYDCLVFCVSSHGNGEHHGNSMVYINDIIPYFNNSSCSHLLGKPKLFIFPNCRGPNRDHALSWAFIVQRDSSDTENDETNTIIDPVQTYSDIKICYATVSGYTSGRDDETGS